MVQRQQARQDFVVGQIGRPAVRRRDRGVELPVRQVQPRRPRVVEAGDRALLLLGVAQAGCVQPCVALLDQLARGRGDRLHARVAHRLAPRRPREGEGAKGCRRVVTWIISYPPIRTKLRAHP